MTPSTLPIDPAGEASKLLWDLRHVPDNEGSGEYPWFMYWPGGEGLLPPATWAACNELIARGQVDFCKGSAFRGTGAVAPPPSYSQRINEAFRLANFWYEQHEGLSARRDALRDVVFDLRPRAEKAEAERDALRAELARAKAELSAAVAREVAAAALVPAKAKAPTLDALQQAIIATLEDLAPSWPAGGVPSSRLWHTLVDRGHVATVRPGRAVDTEAHRFHKAKAALIASGQMTEKLSYAHLGPPKAKASTATPPAEPATAPESEPTFMD